MMRHRMVDVLGWAVCVAWLTTTPLVAQSYREGFHLETLPVGKNVTIPRPATTFVPVTARVVFSSTDTPQSLSLRSISIGNKPATILKVAIFDRQSERVKYVEVKPGTPFVYSFKGLSSITVIPVTKTDAADLDKSLGLKVESDKPLEIAH